MENNTTQQGERGREKKTGTANPAGTAAMYDRRRGTTGLLAAAFLILVLLSIREMRSFLAEPTARTAYGEIKSYRLTDGTQVMLNARTDLDYKEAKAASMNREAWLKGEAWFRVAQVPFNTPFIVHTAPYDIMAVDAVFNVVNRNDRFNIFVEEGEIMLQASNINTGKAIRVQAGEFRALTHQRLVPAAVQQEEVLAWKERKLSLNNTSLKELKSVIETYYGVDVAVPDNSSIKLSGIMPNSSLDVLLQTLEKASGLSCTRRKDEVLIRTKE